MKLKVILITIFIANLSFGQITKDDIKDVLLLQGLNDYTEIEAQSQLLYEQYIEKVSYNFSDLAEGFGYSVLSGISLGAHESNSFGYRNTGWMPKFMRDWYESTQGVYSNTVFGDMFTWREVWKQVDYIADRNAYQSLNKFFEQKWYLALITHWVVKNTFATMIRDKMKHNKLFYSWNVNFVFALPK